MTLTELTYIVAMSQELNFSRAAERCHISQPTLSQAIKKFENRYGIELFERLPQGVALTDIGRAIATQAVRTLDEVAITKNIAEASLSQLTSPLRIGAIHTVGPYLFPHLIPALNKLAPDMPLIIRDNYTETLARQLTDGSLDVAIIALPFTRPSILTKNLYSEEFQILLPKDHALASKDAISSKELSKENVLLLGGANCFRDQVLKACPDCLQNSNEQAEVEGASLETLRHMVASGMGVTILPSTATQVKHYSKTLCQRPFKGRAPMRQIALAWRTSFTRPKVITALSDALASALPDELTKKAS